MILLALMHTLAAVTITLPASATVRGNEVRLGDLASIQGASAEETARIGALTLGYVPAPGYARALTGAEIAARIKSALPGVDCTVAGAARCRIEPEIEVVRGDTLRTEARKALDAALQTRDATVIAEGSQADVQVPKCATRLELRPVLPANGLRSGSLSVPVQVWIDGALYMTSGAAFRIELFENVAVLAHDVRRGDVIESEGIEMRRVCIGPEVYGTPLARAALPGAQALRDMARGSVLTDECVRRAQLVKRGDTVQLQVRKGAIIARSTAVAGEDGMLGEKIRVTTADTKREIAAVVVGRESVELVLAQTR